MNDISWAEVTGNIGFPLLVAAGLFAMLVGVALIRTPKNRRRLTEKDPRHLR